MAIIKCYECGREISSDAPTCPHCGAPKKDSTIRVLFPKTNTILKCYLYDSKGNELAKCNNGEIVSFNSGQPIEITVKMKGFFGSPSIVANPGCRYAVNVNTWGKINIKEVDNLTGTESANNWNG